MGLDVTEKGWQGTGLKLEGDGLKGFQVIFGNLNWSCNEKARTDHRKPLTEVISSPVHSRPPHLGETVLVLPLHTACPWGQGLLPPIVAEPGLRSLQTAVGPWGRPVE